MTGQLRSISNLEKLATSCGPWGRFDRSKDSPDTSSLWVIFSHVKTPEGKFAQSNITKPFQGHKLYLNCADNQWYTQGIGDFSTTLPETVYQLLEATKPFQTTFVGHSMGAYLSLILGKLHANGRYISTSPELDLGLTHSRSFENGVGSDGALRSINDVSEGFQQSDTGITFFGVYDPVDCFFLSQQASDNIGRVYEVPHHHGVTEYFTQNRLYQDILQADFDSELWSSLENRQFLFARSTHGAPQQYLHFYEAYCDYADGKDESTIRAKASTYAGWKNPGWQELRSKMWARIGEPSLSLEAAETAYHYQPDLIQFIDVFGGACLRYGEVSRLNDLIDSMSQAHRKHPVGRRLVEHTRKKLGRGFYERLTQDLERHAPRVNLNKKQRASNLVADLRPAEAAELYQLNKEKRFEKVLELTNSIIDSEFEHDFVLAPQRATALIYGGDTSTGLRLLQGLHTRGCKTRHFARALIFSAQRLQNISLLRSYLELDIPLEWRQSFSSPLETCLEFTNSPSLIANILVELAKCGNVDIDSTLLEIETRFESDSMNAAIARLLPLLADADEFSAEKRLPLALLMQKSGFSALVDTWLPRSERSHDEDIRLHAARPKEQESSEAAIGQ